MQLPSNAVTKLPKLPKSSKLPKFWLMAIMSTVIGLSSSALTGYFFVLGILKSEADPSAQLALSASGVLLIFAELAAFYATSRLPKDFLKEWRWGLLVFGIVLLLYEIYVMSFTQMLLLKNMDLAASANTPRIEMLQKEVQRYQNSADSYRRNAELASGTGAVTKSTSLLDLAAKEDAKAAESRKELAALQPKTVATTTDVLKDENWVLLNAVARSIAMSVSGLILFAFSGALYREALKVQEQREQSEEHLEPEQELSKEQPGQVEELQEQAEEHRERSEEHLEPKQEPVEELREQVEEQPEPTQEPEEPAEEHQEEPLEEHTTVVQDPVFVFEEQTATPYPEVVEALKSNRVKPTIRDIKTFSKVGYAGAKKILDSLVESRVLMQEGREYLLV